mmetsp:Transcript_27175/g.49591  ORF Transcript_27175/g.49591 Transcript_27175/m.49591 type:complete len:228 (+) Transcript_27175:313-996(+)
MVKAAFGQHGSFVQYGNLTIQAADKFHVMLHHHNGAGFGCLHQNIGCMFTLCRCHACGGLIHQQKPRLLGEQHPNLQPLFLPVAQLAGFAEKLILKPNFLSEVNHLYQVFWAGTITEYRQPSTLILERHQQVFLHRLIFKDRGFLKLAPNTGLRDLGLIHTQKAHRFFTPDNPPFVRSGLASHDIHKGGLTSAIWPDHGTHFSFCNLKREIVDGAEPVKGHRDPGDF